MRKISVMPMPAAILSCTILVAVPAAQPAHAQSTTLTGAAVGLGTGALVAGPPGAVVGGIVGGLIGSTAERPTNYYTFTPARRCWRDRKGRRHCR